MNAGVTSERIYDALKARLLSGEILPGARLEPAAFAEMLGSSVTPVRDALHRLVGEHIVEMRLTEGFQLPFMTEVALRDLIAWNAELLRVALRRWPVGETPKKAELPTGNYVGGIRGLFSLIASRSGSVELDRHVEAASDRLAAARAAEHRIYADATSDLDGLAAAVAAGDPRSIARQTAAYHKSRAQLVPAIVEAMYRAA